jgi:hypothetical protein
MLIFDKYFRRHNKSTKLQALLANNHFNTASIFFTKTNILEQTELNCMKL